MGAELPLWTVLPFAALLLSIAVLPLTVGHWWEKNGNKAIVAGALAAVVAVYLLATEGANGFWELVEKLKEYASFIILLASLYIISGGIYIRAGGCSRIEAKSQSLSGEVGIGCAHGKADQGAFG